MRKKNKINFTLLRRVRNHILAEPRRYLQTTSGEEVGKRISPCGTRACIGGWADMLEGDDCSNPFYTNLGRAAEKLGFNDSQAWEVFTAIGPQSSPLLGMTTRRARRPHASPPITLTT